MSLGIKKFELTGDTKIVFGRTLHRIRAVRDFGDVKAGDLGGWVESEQNLSHVGDAWVFDDASVFGDARVYGRAEVYGDAVVYGDASVFGNARVYGDARVYGNAVVYGNADVKSSADYMVFKNTWSSMRWFTYTSSNKMWTVGCFHGTGEELIKKAYKDSEKSGKCYEAIVRAVEAIEAASGRR